MRTDTPRPALTPVPAPGEPAHAAPPPHPGTAAQSSPSTHPTNHVSGPRSPRNSRAYTIANAAPTRPSAVSGVHRTPRAALPTTLIDHARQTRENLLAALQHPRAATQRLHHTHPRERRLTIEERTESPTGRHAPAHARQDHPAPPPRAHPRPPPSDILQQRRQARLAILEQLIERAPRDPRARRDLLDRRLRIPELLDRANRARQQPRTLNLQPTSSRAARPPPDRTPPQPRRRHPPHAYAADAHARARP